MPTAGTLFDLIQRLGEFDDDDGDHPLVLYAHDGADARQRSPALICPRGSSGATCPLDASMSEVLSVAQALDAIAVWSAWRGDLTPSPLDRFDAVMFLARHGGHRPLESDREGM